MKTPITARIPIAVAVLLSNASVVQSQRAPVPGLDEYVARGMRDWNTPGLVISIVKNDSVVLVKGYGVREYGRPELMDPATMLGIGSCSKSFASAAVAKLVDQGRLSWEDPVATYLRWFEMRDPWVTKELRVRDMLAHRAGTDFTIENRTRAGANTPEDLVRSLATLEPVAPFRSKFVYSNHMYTTAGLLIGVFAGTTWDEFVETQFWKPLGMQNTNAWVIKLRESGNRAMGHTMSGGTLHPANSLSGPGPPIRGGLTGPSGTVNSSAADMAQWLRFQLGDGTFNGKRILTKGALDETHTPQTPIRGGAAEAVYWFTGMSDDDLKSHHWAYAMGWFVNDYRGHSMVWHGGTYNGYRCVQAMLPDQQLGVYVGANHPTLLPYAVTLAIFDWYLEAHDKVDWSAQFLAQQRKLERDQEVGQRAR
jgi:CubicO group peptidase (beta-lactamase class C family)